MLKLILVFLLSSSCFADEWSKNDTYREVAFQVINAMDWSQTSQFSRMPCDQNNCFSESNPFLPSHPNQSQINRHFIGGALLHFAVSKTLTDENLRIGFQSLTIFFSAYCVKNNYEMGLHVKF